MIADPSRLWWAALAIALWLLLTGWIIWRAWWTKRRALRRSQALARGTNAVLVAHASQTGIAENLAWLTAEALSRAGTPARVEPLGRLTPDDLAAAGRVLIVASTTGEGDAPDGVERFVARHMIEAADLRGMTYGILALGDRSYDQFCQFGRVLDAWMERSGGCALFDRVEVDNADPGSIRHWQHQLGQLTGHVLQADWSPAAIEPWHLVERVHLNPGSPGGEIYWLAFQSAGMAVPWSAGDIAEIVVPDDLATSREYSIASVPAEGHLALIVRRMVRADGTPGRVSGWLTQDVAVGGAVGLRIRRNAGFHAPPIDCPLILIGNGTGLAGLRAHWQLRDGSDHAGTWLLFGERTLAHDALLDSQLKDAQARGVLTRIDRTFSRDPEDGRYVQALIDEHAETLREWIDRQAVVLVCGSREGMANSVDDALIRVFGPERVLHLKSSGRYRRDVY